MPIPEVDPDRAIAPEEYRRPAIEAVLTPEDLEREVLFAGGLYQEEPIY